MTRTPTSIKQGTDAAQSSEEDLSVTPHGVLTDFYAAPDHRARFVQQLFDGSARHYDRVSSLISLGTDRFYRKQALRRVGLRPDMKLLDVASGTGLVAAAARQLDLPPQNLVGLDPSAGMLMENQRRNGIALVQSLGETLPFAHSTFDCITMGYALRHAGNLGRLFQEFFRVLKPEGRVLILEITRPSSAMGCRLMRFYLCRLAPILAKGFSRRAKPDRLLKYYWETIAHCVPPDTILQCLAGAGFTFVQHHTFSPILSEFIGRK